uniref:UDP-N-acetylmuramoyl-tripeptide--D-alanyl-D- alanine ligase n=1 Tax=Ningiella ruwaisensis TaxID=2364274 RepID=UPI0010A01733|nr:UDP-N-acetylmuramoyl-tripeptide--D-alanyl-D-alanine ligase [Ningiella ruwaisensis]
MIEISLGWFTKAISGELSTNSVIDMRISSVSTDTRNLQKGDVFIALVGNNFNGHDYIPKALEKGASAVVVSQVVDCPLPLIRVKDTRIALGELAAAVRNVVNPKVVGITGSSGKTTVKEMASAILAQRGKVLATKGNFNNDIGVPLTLLNLEKQHEYAVVEMGANHQGEIDYTTMLVRPDAATIINAAPSHLQGFGSLFGVARAKSEIFRGLGEDGVAVVNTDSQFYEFWQGKNEHHRMVTFSPTSESGHYHAINRFINNDGCGEFELVTPQGKVAIRLRVPGQHNIGNAVVAAALSMEVGASLENVQKGLFDMRGVSGRLNVKSLGSYIRVIDDSYNANVASTKAAIDLLVNYQGPRVLVFGDMGELGDQSQNYHIQIGEYAKEKGVDALITIGQLSEHTSRVFSETGTHCADVDAIITQLNLLIDAAINANKTPINILVKGSRSAKMERVVEALNQSYAQSAQHPGVTQNEKESGSC